MQGKVVFFVVIEPMAIEGATILFLTGDLDGPAAAHVAQTAARHFAEGCQTLVLDLSGVDRVYTAGLVSLTHLQESAARAGRELSFCGARPFVREILRLTMLDRGLNLHLDLNSALDQAVTAVS